jgi:D-glycero-alpha-D-manno-heptose 1-phosphate guanylyltransferase
MEAIILAGGEGRRLRAVVPDLPKPMADIAGRPFLSWLLARLNQQGVGRVIISVGYKSEVIQNYFGNVFDGMEISYSVEAEPLGTGGAMRLAVEQAGEAQVVVLNGDTYTDLDLPDFVTRYQSSRSDLAVAVSYLNDVARYGAIIIEEKSDIVVGFDEKRGLSSGYINAGVYCFSRDIFVKYEVPEKFSFERDFLAKQLAILNPVAYKGVRAFIDIGVPEDYSRAQTVIPEMAAA